MNDLFHRTVDLGKTVMVEFNNGGKFIGTVVDQSWTSGDPWIFVDTEGVISCVNVRYVRRVIIFSD